MLTLLFLVTIAGLFVWGFIYIVDQKELAIPTFFGNRKPEILEEGFNIYPWPFCKLITYSTEPREQKSFTFTSNTVDDEVNVKVSFRFKLPTPCEMGKITAEYGELNFADGTFLLTYDKMQKSIEDDAEKRTHEMFDEQLAKVPTALALNKQVNDIIQVIVERGLNYNIRIGDANVTAEGRLIQMIEEYKNTVVQGATQRGEQPTEVRVPEPVGHILAQQDKNIRGIRRLFLEDYGAEMTVFAVTIEPSPRTSEIRSKMQQQEIMRKTERQDMEFIKTAGVAAGMTPEQAKEYLLVSRKLADKTYSDNKYEISVKGLEGLSPETIESVGKIAEALAGTEPKKLGQSKKKRPGKKPPKGGSK